LETLKYEALPQILAFTPDFPFIVVIPQLTEAEDYWTEEEVVASLFLILEEVQENYAVDSEKIYLTGVSLGGNGVWEIGLRYPGRFAALVPVAGFYGDTASVEVPENICDLKDVPVWAFHGAKDPIVPLFAEEDLVNALKSCGGNAQLTVYPDGDHDISGQVYNDQELYTWLLSQSLK
jgi:predicted peptidase